MSRTAESIDALLETFIVAWHAGAAPDAESYIARASEPDRAELTDLLHAFLQMAPTVEAGAARRAELLAVATVARVAALEGD